MTDEQALDGEGYIFEDNVFSIERELSSGYGLEGIETLRLTKSGILAIRTTWNIDGYDDDSDSAVLSKDELLQLAHAIINEWGDE